MVKVLINSIMLTALCITTLNAAHEPPLMPLEGVPREWLAEYNNHKLYGCRRAGSEYAADPEDLCPISLELFKEVDALSLAESAGALRCYSTSALHEHFIKNGTWDVLTRQQCTRALRFVRDPQQDSFVYERVVDDLEGEVARWRDGQAFWRDSKEKCKFAVSSVVFMAFLVAFIHRCAICMGPI